MVMYPHIKELMPDEISGTAMAFVNFFAFVGAAVFMHGIGFFMEKRYPGESFTIETFKAVFIIWAVCLAIVAFAYLFTRDKRYCFGH